MPRSEVPLTEKEMPIRPGTPGSHRTRTSVQSERAIRDPALVRTRSLPTEKLPRGAREFYEQSWTLKGKLATEAVKPSLLVSWE